MFITTTTTIILIIIIIIIIIIVVIIIITLIITATTSSSPPGSSQVRNTIFSSITAFHDNTRVAIAHAEKPIVMIWNILQGRTERLLEGNPELHTAIGHLEVSRDNKKLLGLSRSHALVWEVEGKRLIKTIDLSVKDDPHYCLYAPLKVTVSADWRFLFVRHNFGNALKVCR
jgi:hypothetical protein